MSDLPSVKRSAADLAAFLADNPIDVARLDRDGFRRWISALVESLKDDPVFSRRAAIRDLRRTNRRKLRYRRGRISDALLAYRDCGCADDVEAAARQLDQTQKAVDGLRGAVAEGRADPDKLAAFEARLVEVDQRHAALLAKCNERERLDRARRSLDRFEIEIGLPDVQAELEDIQRNRGRRSSSGGRRFEDVSEALITKLVIPEFDRPVICLSGLTLGCARGEFDHLLVTPPEGHKPVEVLAMVEAKRNINDLAHGFRLRQENLAWLRSDDTGFDPDQYRTSHYPAGRFDRPFDHEIDGVTYRFDPSSFAGFERHPATGDYLRGLWFVTEARSLNGVSGGEREKISYKLATDRLIRFNRPSSLDPLHDWVLDLIAPLQARGVLERYADADLARQILLVQRPARRG